MSQRRPLLAGNVLQLMARPPIEFSLIGVIGRGWTIRCCYVLVLPSKEIKTNKTKNICHTIQKQTPYCTSNG